MKSTRKTVLLVEDEYDTRELLGRALERAGYACVSAGDREQALSVAHANESIDVVVTDVVLGADNRGGLALLTDLRTLGVRAPVVVITAYADVEKLKIALNEGAAHFLEKPFSAPKLLAAIERVLANHRALDHAVEELLTRAQLTDKELTVARLLLDGLSSSEIAEVEHNSPKTIRQHVTQIYAKCGVTSRAQFFRLAYLR
ncbi:MAG TPA: response regulator [Polyangiaceae bacterium]|jgi:DNA-binding NarL/FixJ family response regulator